MRMIDTDPTVYDSPLYMVLDLEFDGHPRDPDGKVVLGVSATFGSTTGTQCLEPSMGEAQEGVYALWEGGSVLPYRPPSENATQSDLDPFSGHPQGTPSGGMRELVAEVEKVCNAGGFLVAHNAVAELGWLAKHGLDLREVVVYDTMLGEWVLQAGMPAHQGQLSLEGTAARRSVGVKSEWTTILFNGVRASEIPYTALLERCTNDVLLTAKSFKLQLQELKSKSSCSYGSYDSSYVKLKDQKLEAKELSTIKNTIESSSIESFIEQEACQQGSIAAKQLHHSLVAVQFCRSMMTPMLCDMQREPLLLDKALVDFEYQKATARREEILRTMYILTGGININSRPQLATYVYGTLGFTCTEKTPSGAPSVKEEVLEALVAKTKEQREFKELMSEYIALNTMISKNLELFYGLCDEQESKMWVEIRQGTTATHRLSSIGVPFKHSLWKQPKKAQGQNIPRTLKHLFRAPEGYKIGEVDGSALEFRVAASMSGDQVALQEIVDLYDIHSGTAAVYKCSRQDAKPRSFKPMYGGTGGSPLDKKYSKFFREKYHVINGMQEAWVTEAMLTKQVRSPLGLIYNFPDISVDGRGYCNRKRDVYNYPIQGAATAEIIPIAMLLMWYNQPQGVRMVLQVHDSIVSYVKPEAEQEWLRMSTWALTSGCRDFLKRVYKYDLGTVELGIGAKLGTHWGTGEEVTYQTTHEGVVYQVVKGQDGRKTKVVVTGGSNERQ